MTIGFKVIDEAPQALLRGRPSNEKDFVELAKAAKENPDKVILAGGYFTPEVASRVKKGKYGIFQPEGSFVASITNVGKVIPGKGELHIKYVGD